MRKWFYIATFVLLTLAAVNDVSHYAKTRYDLDNIAKQAVRVAAANRQGSRDDNANLAMEYAASQGATLYLYDQTEQQVHVWVRMPVQGTWLLAPIMAGVNGQPLSTPYQVEIDRAASIQ